MLRAGKVALVLGLSLAQPAGAGKTDEQRYEKLFRKIPTQDQALSGRFRPRQACVCLSLSPPQGGFLVRNGYEITCGVPGFDAFGTMITYGPCEDYTVLPKR